MLHNRSQQSCCIPGALTLDMSDIWYAVEIVLLLFLSKLPGWLSGRIDMNNVPP